MFAAPDLIPTIADIVDQYRVLAFPRDYAKAQELIKRWNDEVMAPLGLLRKFKMPKGMNGCTGREAIAKGRPEPGKAQEKDAARGAGMGKAESIYVTRKPKPNAPQDGSGQSQHNQNNKADNGDGGYVPQSAQEAMDMREAKRDADLPPSMTPGQGHHQSMGGIPDDVKDMLDNVVQEVLDRKDVQQDVKTKQKVIVGGDGKHEDVAKNGKFDKTMAPPTAISMYRRFAKELERLRDECEPMWHREEASGKLNVQRAIRGCEIDEAFDRWDEGTDGADVEAVILIDRSGSMCGGNDKQASIACWTIKRSLEQIGAPVTVYAFDDQTELAYAKTERAHKTMYKFIYGNGGTNPYGSLVAAEQLLMASRKKNKMLFVVTDGAFDNRKNDEIIERISKRGVLTVMTLIMADREMEYYKNNDQYNEDTFRHKAEIFGRIASAKDLLPFAKAVVTGAIKKRGR